jgi:MYXO-CTERM domain-containing protein
MPAPNSRPNIFADEMPWEEGVEQAAMVGPNESLSDRTQDIDVLLATWNEQHGWPEGGGSEGGSESGSESGSGGSEGDTGDSGISEGSACACSSGEQGGALTMLSLVFGVLGFGARRRRD